MTNSSFGDSDFLGSGRGLGRANPRQKPTQIHIHIYTEMTEKQRIDNDTERDVVQSNMELKQFEQAVLSVQRGDRVSGYQMLRQVLLADPSYAPAWFWMSRLVEAGRARECLERALALDPNLKAARDALATLRAYERERAQPRAAEPG